MKVPFTLGTVGHFGLAARDPKRSAKWFMRVLGLRKEFEFEEGVAVGNEHVTIALSKGKPSPKTIGHMSFHLENMTALRKALEHLKKHKVKVEDPGNEIGPESPDHRIWAYGSMILTAIAGNFLSKAAKDAHLTRKIRDRKVNIITAAPSLF